MPCVPHLRRCSALRFAHACLRYPHLCRRIVPMCISPATPCVDARYEASPSRLVARRCLCFAGRIVTRGGVLLRDTMPRLCYVEQCRRRARPRGAYPWQFGVHLCVATALLSQSNSTRRFACLCFARATRAVACPLLSPYLAVPSHSIASLHRRTSAQGVASPCRCNASPPVASPLPSGSARVRCQSTAVNAMPLRFISLLCRCPS